MSRQRIAPRVLAAVLAAPLLAGAAAAQCCGDCNDDGRVAINELIVAVNNNLDDCAGAGPRSCPIDFFDDNTQPGTPDCYYTGRWNPTCGDALLETAWRGQGDCAEPPCVVAVFFTEFDSVDCGGEIISPTEAILFGCFLGPDDEDFVEATGEISLANDGATLVMDPCEAPFTIGDDQCPVTFYQGRLGAVLTPSAGAAVRRRRNLGDVPARLDRLRQRHHPAPPKANLRRAVGGARPLPPPSGRSSMFRVD